VSVFLGAKLEGKRLALGVSDYVEERSVDPVAPGEVSSLGEMQRHLARELHDQVAQPLIGLVLEIRKLRASIDGSNPLAPELVRIEESTRQVLRYARETMIDLREVGELRINLARALETDVPMPADCNLSVHVTTRWPGHTNGWVAFNLLRIVQQAVANSCRHGRARKIDVVLDVGPGGDAVVVILDDGVGIDDAPHGFGMQGMAERAEILGGSFTAGPRQSGGTRVEVRVPAWRLA
jgi:signal transduction histidine kinase